MKENNTYNKYATALVGEVPIDDFNLLVNLFIDDASVTMGNDYDDEALDMIIAIIKKEYNSLPIYYIASAFKKGSMGKYGKEGGARLIPKNIFFWIEQESISYNRYLAHKEQKEKGFSNYDAMDLHKYPAGKAIIKKIEWLKSGAITIDDWEKVSLKDLAEMIGRGQNVTPEDFGIIKK